MCSHVVPLKFMDQPPEDSRSQPHLSNHVNTQEYYLPPSVCRHWCGLHELLECRERSVVLDFLLYGYLLQIVLNDWVAIS